jgi:hypothetical protein
VKVRLFQRRIVPLAIGVGMSIAVLGGTAVAAPTLPQPNQSVHAAIDCTLGLTPGQAFQFFGGAGPDRTGKPPDGAAFLGLPNLGAVIQQCATPAP